MTTRKTHPASPINGGGKVLISTINYVVASVCVSAGMNPLESAFAESFISKARRERALELLASSKNRRKFTSTFDHHGRDCFIPEFIRSIVPRHQHPPNIADILRAMGAPETCHVIGGEHDGKDMELLTALKQIVGYGTGTVLSCIPGKLAYFEGEIRERFLLVRIKGI